MSLKPNQTKIVDLLSDPDDPYLILVDVSEHASCMDMSEDEFMDAISELESAGIVTSRRDPNTGFESIALPHLAAAYDAPYEELKSRVYDKAKLRGLWPKWTGRGVWHLLAGDHPVLAGSLEDLDGYLSKQGQLS